MVASISKISSLSEMMQALAGFNAASFPPVGINVSGAVPGAQAGSPARIGAPAASMPRVDVPESISAQIRELETVHNISALRSVAVTAFNTVNSSIKRVHQGQ